MSNKEPIEYIEETEELPTFEKDSRGWLTITINGKSVIMPTIEEDFITFGIRRKTRNMSEERASEELVALLLEAKLTETELEAWDSLTPKELELIGKSGALDAAKKD